MARPDAPVASTTPDGPAAPAELRLRVGGMTCAGCAASVQRAIESILDRVVLAIQFMALFSLVLPFNVAFKIGSVLGLLVLPGAAYAAARRMRLQ